jgi:hypothetical protein
MIANFHLSPVLLFTTSIVFPTPQNIQMITVFLGRFQLRSDLKGTTSTNCNTVPTASSSSSSKTNYDPQHNHAHLLHSIMGLDRYPNYISRWSYNIDDIDKLQDALTHQLEKVKHQKSDLIQRRKRMNEIIEHAMASYQDIDWTVLTVPLSLGNKCVVKFFMRMHPRLFFNLYCSNR